MMKRLLTATLIALLPSLAFSQSTVIQGGSFTAGHVPQYNNSSGQPTLKDGGTAAGTSAAGGNPSTLGVTARCSNPPCIAQGAGPNGEDVVIYDGPTADAEGYHYLGFSANIGSKATITTGAAGGAAAQGLQFIIDGTTYAFPDDFPTIPVTVPNGGTGRQTLTDYNVLVGAGTSAVALVAPSATSGVPLISQGSSANPAYGTAAIAGGGTGATTANGALNNLLPNQSGQNGKILSTDGTDAAWISVAGTGTVTQINTDATMQGGPITTSGTLGLADAADGTILANISGGVAQPTPATVSAVLDDQIGSARGTVAMRGAATWGALTPGTNGLPLISNGPGSDLSYSQLSINNLAIAGQTQGDIAYYDGAMWTRLGIGTSGQALSGGTNPVWQAINGTQIRMGSDAQGDVLYFNGTNYVRLGAGTNGQFLQTQGAGANPQWADGSAQTTSTWTPSITFQTPGDLAVTYGLQVGGYIKTGKMVVATFTISTSSFTHTSASGSLIIGTLPFAAANVTNQFGSGSTRFQGITKASYTQITPLVTPNTSTLQLSASGSGQAVAVIGASDMPTGGSVNLIGTITYWTD